MLYVRLGDNLSFTVITNSNNFVKQTYTFSSALRSVLESFNVLLWDRVLCSGSHQLLGHLELTLALPHAILTRALFLSSTENWTNTKNVPRGHNADNLADCVISKKIVQILLITVVGGTGINGGGVGRQNKRGRRERNTCSKNRTCFLTLTLTGLFVFINFTPHIVIQQKKSYSMETRMSKGADAPFWT